MRTRAASNAVPVAKAETHGLILSAGVSRRMGHPKALLPLGDSTFVEQLVERLDSVCATVTVVVGAHHRAIRAVLGEGAHVILAKDWFLGMRASLRAGLRHTPDGPVLLTHVDRPTVLSRTLDELISTPGNAAVVPVYRGHSGHPVRIPHWMRDRLERSDQMPLRDVLKRSGYERLHVTDPGVVVNINDRRDYDRLRARL